MCFGNACSFEKESKLWQSPNSLREVNFPGLSRFSREIQLKLEAQDGLAVWTCLHDMEPKTFAACSFLAGR